MNGVERALRYTRVTFATAIAVYAVALVCAALDVGPQSLWVTIGLSAIGVIALAGLVWIMLEFSF